MAEEEVLIRLLVKDWLVLRVQIGQQQVLELGNRARREEIQVSQVS